MSSGDRRNPYVILGIPFGASESEARSGFARASRRLRNNPEQVYSMEDLTWALHQIEQILEKPKLALHVYRVPADPEAFRAPGEPGLFNPPPTPLERRTDPATQEDITSLRLESLRRRLRTRIEEMDFPWSRPYENER